MAGLFDDVFVVTYNKYGHVIPQLAAAFGVSLPPSHVLTRTNCTNKNAMFEHIWQLFGGNCQIVFVDDLLQNIMLARSLCYVHPIHVSEQRGITAQDFRRIRQRCQWLRRMYPGRHIVLAVDFDETLTTGAPASYIDRALGRSLLLPGPGGVYVDAPDGGCGHAA